METTIKRPALTQGWIVFGLVWFGQLISLAGSGLSGFALGVWYYQAEGSVTQLALFSFFNVVPGVLLSPFAGVLVDRWDRRRAMLFSDIGAGLCTVAIWLILAAGQSGTLQVQPWFLYIPVGISSAFNAFRWPAYYAATTLLVPKQHLGRANGLIGMGQAVAQIAAPALAGILVVSIGLRGVILIDLSTFAVAIGTLLLVRFPQPAITAAVKEAEGKFLQAATYGWKYIKQRPGLLGLLLFVAAANVSLGFMMVLIIPLVLSFADASTLGVVLAIAGLGMLAGSITMGIWGGPKRLINGVVGFTFLAGVLLMLGGLPPSAGLAAGIAFLYLFTIPIISGCSQTIWQRKVAPEVQGRVFAVQRMIVMASAPLSRIIVGPLVDNLFEPWLAKDGLLAGSVGQIIGTGPGRGIALVLVALGLFNALVTVVALFSPRLMRVETELPDAIDNLPVQTEQHSTTRKGNRMKRLRKWLLRLLIALVVILVIVVAGSLLIIRRAWPEVSGTLTVPGLNAQVQVIRDKWGVPHIYTDNEHDLAFAQGYVHAQDRLWQMEMNRAVATGKISAIVGAVAVRSDRAVRLLGLVTEAEKMWKTIDEDTRGWVEAYVAGVNAYIDSHRDRLPAEYIVMGVTPAAWTPIDVLSESNFLGLMLSHNYRMELLRGQVIAKVGVEGAQDLFAPYAQGTPIIVPPGAGNYAWMRDADFETLNEMDQWLGDPTPGWGSNNWVISGSRTATGQPILENDTHLGTQLPSVWYENDLHGGRFNVTGFSWPGIPFIIIGHNQRIAWGETTLGQDVQDYYIEKFDNPDHPTQYEYMGQWYPITNTVETIEVRGSAPITFTMMSTRHGPIMTEFMSAWTNMTEPLALRWAIHEGNRIPEAMKLLNLASNWEEFRTAMSRWDAPGLNMVYADVDGNIGYQATGRTPIRVKNHQGLVPVPGWTGEYEWQGFIPFDQMPSSFNPPAGFIVTANNRVTTSTYTYTLAYDWFPGYRAQRISDLLAANNHVTLDDVKTIDADTYSLPAQALRPYILAAVQPANEQEAQALEILKNWDLHLTRDSAGASIYERWYVTLLQNTIMDELGPDVGGRYLAGQYERHGNQHVPMMIDTVMPDANNHWFDDITTPELETRDDIVRRSFSETVQWLSDNYGKDPQGWTWGRLHTLTFGHLTFDGVKPLDLIFNGPTISLPGDAFSVDVASFTWNKPFAVIHAVSQRMIVDLGNLENSVSMHPTGQSERLLHPHREDFIPLWANVQYHPMFSERSDIEQNSEATLVLTP